jgi:hypothetical protein
MTTIPTGATTKGDKTYNASGQLIELFEGKWCVVLNGDRSGWWRYHDHYDRNGYCDNPARGY